MAQGTRGQWVEEGGEEAWSEPVTVHDALGEAPVLVKLEDGHRGEQDSMSFSLGDLLGLEGEIVVGGRRLVLAHYASEVEQEDGGGGDGEEMYLSLLTIPWEQLPPVDVRLYQDKGGHAYSNFITNHFPHCNWQEQQEELLDSIDEDDYDLINEISPVRPPPSAPASSSATRDKGPAPTPSRPAKPSTFQTKSTSTTQAWQSPSSEQAPPRPPRLPPDRRSSVDQGGSTGSDTSPPPRPPRPPRRSSWSSSPVKGKKLPLFPSEEDAKGVDDDTEGDDYLEIIDSRPAKEKPTVRVKPLCVASASPAPRLQMLPPTTFDPPSDDDGEDYEIPTDCGPPLEEMTCQQLCCRLEQCGMQRLAHVCRTNHLDGAFLCTLSNEVLQKPPFSLDTFEISVKLERIKTGWVPK